MSENSEEAALTFGQPGAIPIDDEDEASGLALRTLRAIRVLRPLKLVSGVPSKFECAFVLVAIMTLYSAL